MPKTFTLFRLKVNTAFAVGFFVLAAVAAAFTPRVINMLQAQNACNPVFETPIFNPYSISDTGAPCTDFSFMAASVNGSSWQPDNGPGANNIINAQPGDTIRIQLYIHNGARENGDPNITTARGIQLSTSVDGNTTNSHSISASVTANNTVNSLSGTMYVNTGSDTKLEVVSNGDLPGSVNSTMPLPDQLACFPYVRFYTFTLSVVGQQVTPPPAQVSGHLNANLNSNICPPTARLDWGVDSGNPIGIAVFPAGSNSPIGGTGSFSGSIDVDVQPGQSYGYELWEVDWGNGGQKLSMLSSASVNVPSGICQQAQPQSFNLSVNPPQVCVGQRSTFSINNATSGLNGKQIFWTSWHNTGSGADPTGENMSGYNQYIQNGSWSEQTNRDWNASDVGDWTKRAQFLDQNYNVIAEDDVDFTVLPSSHPACGGGQQQNPPLVCAPGNQTVNVGQQVNVQASGGSGSYTVTTSDGTNFNFGGSGTNIFSGTFNTAGTKTVTVRDNTNAAPAVCTVNVQPVTTPITPVCGSSNGGTFSSAPTGNLCSSGTPSGVSGNGPWSWTCAGSNNQTVSCSANKTNVPTPVNGVCGSANGSTSNNAPTANLCSVGQASFMTGSGPWTWKCLGTNNGNDAVCNANKTQAPACVPPTTGTISGPDTVAPGQQFNLSCSFGSANDFIPAPSGCTFSGRNGAAANFSCTAPSAPGSYSYTCQAQNQAGFTNFCSLPNAVTKTVQVVSASVNGVCGPANGGVFDNAPSGSQLCSSGSASGVSGSGPWSWTCGGQNGGTTVSCSAGKTVQACVPNANVNMTFTSLVKSGNTYSTTLRWTFSSGSHPFRLTQINPGSTSETTLTTTSSDNFTVSGLQAGSTYIFKLYDTTCGTFLASISVTTPAAPGQLVCTVANPTISSGSAAGFSASGGTAPYNWSGDGSPSTGSGPNYNPVYTNSGTNAVTRVVTLTDSAGQSVQCNVVVNGTPGSVAGGNCNNSDASCNTNTNNNNQTSTGNNSANQNNQSNINGNNNTVTQTNNNCVNNSCNTVYYYSSTSNPYVPPVPSNEYRQLSVQKTVRNINSGSYQKTITTNNNDTVQFQVVVTNTGNQPINNVVLSDPSVNGLQWTGSTQISGNNYNNNNFNSWSGNNLNIGTMFTGQSVTVTFQARVVAACGTSIQNVAYAYGDNVPQRQDDAWVFVSNCGSVQGGNISLNYSKKAWNDTKNTDATTRPASKEDFITYTLTVNNSGNQPATNFVITDDLSQVLPYADVVDNGGGTVSGNVISYPGITVPAGGSVSRQFRVRVKYFLADNLNYTMVNTYGNTVTININAPRVAGAFVAPKTGAETNAFIFSGLMVAAFAIAKKREYVMAVMKMIFA